MPQRNNRNNQSNLKEAFSNKNMENAVKSIISFLSKHFNCDFANVSGLKITSMRKQKNELVYCHTFKASKPFGPKKMNPAFRFNWRKNKDSAEIVSINFYTNYRPGATPKFVLPCDGMGIAAIINTLRNISLDSKGLIDFDKAWEDIKNDSVNAWTEEDRDEILNALVEEIDEEAKSNYEEIESDGFAEKYEFLAKEGNFQGGSIGSEIQEFIDSYDISKDDLFDIAWEEGTIKSVYHSGYGVHDSHESNSYIHFDSFPIHEEEFELSDDLTQKLNSLSEEDRAWVLNSSREAYISGNMMSIEVTGTINIYCAWDKVKDFIEDEYDLKFDDWFEENYSGVSAEYSEAIVEMLDKESLSVSDIDDITDDYGKGVRVKYGNTEWWFLTDEEADDEWLEYHQSLIDTEGATVYYDWLWKANIDEKKIGEEYSQGEYDYAHEEPDSWLDEEPGEMEKCGECNGTGKVKDDDGNEEECWDCDGEGEVSTGEWTDEQRERAGEKARENVEEDPLEWLAGIYGGDSEEYNDIIQKYINIDGLLEDIMLQGGRAEDLGRYDGNEYEHDNIYYYRTN